VFPKRGSDDSSAANDEELRLASSGRRTRRSADKCLETAGARFSPTSRIVILSSSSSSSSHLLSSSVDNAMRGCDLFYNHSRNAGCSAAGEFAMLAERTRRDHSASSSEDSDLAAKPRMQVDHLRDSFVLRGAANLFISRGETGRVSCREKAAIGPERHSPPSIMLAISAAAYSRAMAFPRPRTASFAVAARAKRATRLIHQ